MRCAKFAGKLVFVVLIITCNIATAQQDVNTLYNPADTAIKNYSTYKRSLTFGGLLQTRSVLSLTDNVDVNGKNYNSTAPGVASTFLIKRARLQVKANVNDHFSANFLINFADFNSVPTNKVLENAYMKYSLNKHLNVQAGQFRPFFGTEDLYPADLIRSLDYSNQYTAFGNNGWQSFQIGVSVFGDITNVDKKQLPLRYYIGVYNGNGRNQPTDNDNTKNVYTRFEADFSKRLTVGINGGLGSNGNGDGNAWGGDFSSNFVLSKKWKLLFGGEYKQGTNFTIYNSTTGIKPSLNEFRMQGFYLFPVLRYEYEQPRVRAIEFSARYEYFDENYILNSNVRQTLIPNVSFVFADNYYAMLQAGVAIDMFKHNVPLTTNYSRNIAYLQFQIRF
ncbi:porin [Chitinophagaceae bacterium LWZ2-11]